MTTIIYNGKTLLADRRATSRLTKTANDVADKLVMLNHLNITIGRDKLVAIGCAGIESHIFKFVKELALHGGKDLHKILTSVFGVQLVMPSVRALFLTEVGICYSLEYKNDTLVLIKEKGPTTIGSGAKGAGFIDILKSQGIKITDKDRFFILSKFDRGTSPTYVEYNIKRNSITQPAAISAERKAELSKAIADYFSS